VDGIQDARYQVYWAVVDGRMRARLGGRVLSPEEVFRLRESQWSGEGEDRYALPADIELSVEDALTIWGSEGYVNGAERTAPTEGAGAARSEARVTPLVKTKLPKGPAAGSVRRFDKKDRALFPKITKLMQKGMTLTAATQKLANQGKVAGVGTPQSRAKRLTGLYRQEVARPLADTR